MQIEQDDYWRKANLKSVVDGDTIRLTIDLGYRIFVEHSIRLLGVKAPRIWVGTEEDREKGRDSRGFVIRWFDLHGAKGCGNYQKWPFMLMSAFSDGFGRYLGQVYCLKGHCLNDEVIDMGFAERYVSAK